IITVPGLEDISMADLIGIRRNSEEFGEWRRSLGSALRRIDEDVVNGKTLDQTFQGELAVIEERALRMKNELKGKSLRNSLRSATINTAIGAMAVYGGAETSQVLGHSFDSFSKLVTLAPVPLLTMLFWLLFNRPAPAKLR